MCQVNIWVRLFIYLYFTFKNKLSRLHTETGNIWTHLVGFLVFSWLAIVFYARPFCDICDSTVEVYLSLYSSVSLCCPGQGEDGLPLLLHGHHDLPWPLHHLPHSLVPFTSCQQVFQEVGLHRHHCPYCRVIHPIFVLWFLLSGYILSRVIAFTFLYSSLLSEEFTWQ